MPEEIITILISAGTGAFITLVGSIILKKIEIRAERKNKKIEREYRKEDNYFEIKKEAYSNGLKYLLYLKKLFSITYEEVFNNKETKEKIEQMHSEVKDCSALIRLYSSDIVFDFFNSLVDTYYPYFLVGENEERLTENSIRGFDKYVSIMGRIMNKDLGYKEFANEEEDMIECPKCGKKHPIYESCPKCMMSIFEYLNYKDISDERKENK